MALRKSVDTDFGIAGDYWRVSQTNINWTTMIAHVVLLQYVSEEARRSGRNAIGSEALDVDITDLLSLQMPLKSVMDVASIVYALVRMGSGLLADAEDVLDPGQVVVALPTPVVETPVVEPDPPVVDEPPIEDVPPIVEPPAEETPVQDPPADDQPVAETPTEEPVVEETPTPV